MRKLLVLLMIVASLLAACTGGAATPTEEAGAATEEAGGDTGGDTGGAVELSESFSDDTATSGTLALNYPSGWTQAGTADALILTSGDPGVGIAVAVMPSAAAAAMGTSPADIVSAFSSQAAVPGVTYSEPEAVTAGENEGAVVTATTAGASTAIMVVSVGDGYVFLTLTAPEADFEANRPVLDAIAASVTLGS